MKKAAYLQNADVQAFIQWIAPLLDQPGAFRHQYTQLKPKLHWQCDSLYNAYENYEWKKQRMAATTAHLGALSAELRESVQRNDSATCLAVSQRILKWGGVTASNSDNLIARHQAGQLISFFRRATQTLASHLADDEAIPADVEMNSGFTKLYALLLPDFVIYDSRVGAALGLLVRRFCEEQQLRQVPELLAFAYANARPAKGHAAGPNPRDPRTAAYSFPALRNDPVFHTRHNLRANWLLTGILDTTTSRFNALQEPERLRALEAALFMIGYQVV